MIDLEKENQASMFLYIRGSDEHGGKKALVLQWISRRYGNQSLMLDALMTRNQTVVLYEDQESEIVLELRPRRLTPIERAKICHT